MEAALLEDNKEVLATLDRKNKSRGSTSAEGGKTGRNSSPSVGLRSSARAMLEVDIETSRRASTGFSTSYINHSPRTTAAHPALHRNPLDTSNLPSSKQSRSAATSPIDMNHPGALFHGERHRTASDTGSYPASFGPRAGPSSTAGPNAHITVNLPSGSGGHVVPKKNTRGSGWARGLVPSAMAEVVRGSDLSVFGATDRGRNHSTEGLGTRLSKSRSPGGFLRSSSPGGKGKQADRRRSESRTRPPNSSLTSSLSRRPRAGSESSVDTQGSNGPRLKKNHMSRNGAKAVDDTSDETNSSDEESRGRRKLEGRDDPVASKEPRREQTKHKKTMYEAIEQESYQVAAMIGRKQQLNSATAAPNSPLKNPPQTEQGLRSRSDPEITLTSPSGERSKASRPKCRPTTSFERTASRPSSAYLAKISGKREVAEAQINNPDARADISDIGHAQKLSIRRTIITNPHPNRTVRQIYRGDFSKIQKEAKDLDNKNPRRLRKYLVATDLSSEAAHALEWCIGTVLRDGDTLFAVYCVDEDVGITPPEGATVNEIREHAPDFAQSTATPIFGASNPPIALPSGLPKLESGNLSVPSSPMGRRSKAELERFRAVHDITERVEKLLRKTKLQVKVIIEVIHCKSPKHLITEIIDLVSPTLVVLGSRGRSALKGVILGSFSNYLVTKSSVPVMVARKKLHSKKKFKRPETQHANNLANAAVKTMIAATEPGLGN